VVAAVQRDQVGLGGGSPAWVGCPFGGVVQVGAGGGDLAAGGPAGAVVLIWVAIDAGTW
jgi:hypothetical protein